MAAPDGRVRRITQIPVTEVTEVDSFTVRLLPSTHTGSSITAVKEGDCEPHFGIKAIAGQITRVPPAVEGEQAAAVVFAAANMKAHTQTAVAVYSP